MRLIRSWTLDGESICTFYEGMLASRGERFRGFAERMIALILAVEAHVQAPDHYCTISHRAFYMTEHAETLHGLARLLQDKLSLK